MHRSIGKIFRDLVSRAQTQRTNKQAVKPLQILGDLFVVCLECMWVCVCVCENLQIYQKQRLKMMLRGKK